MTTAIKYRRFYIACIRKQYVIKTLDGNQVKAAKSLAAAKAEIDRIMQGGDRTDASKYGCPI